MNSEERDNRKNQRIGMLATVLVHGAIVLLFFFLTAYRAPNPPAPEYGLEVNFGMDMQGDGDVQPLEPVGNDIPKEEPVQEQKQETPTPVKEEVKEEIISKEESPVVVKEEKKKPAEKKVVVKEPVKPVEEKKVVKVEPVEQKTTTAQENTGKPGKDGNHGDDPGAKGDKGNPEGKLDAQALYGNPGGGGGGGVGLDMAGWTWDRKPNPKLPESEYGRIVFEIEVDQDGEIIRCQPLERGLSPQAEKICKEEILKLTFTPTGKNVPAVSKGRITIVVRAQ